MGAPLRVLLADDERPARSLLAALLRSHDDVVLVAEAVDGRDALEKIEQLRPDLALLDLQMPELDGMELVRLLRPGSMPLVAFVTAWDQYAIDAFELNAIDYLLKPVEGARLRETLNRTHERLERLELREEATDTVREVAESFGTPPADPLKLIPVRRRDETILVPVEKVIAVVADGELLHLYGADRSRWTISHRLKDLEPRLEREDWIRVGRGALVRISAIERLVSMPGGTLQARLRSGQELAVSRLQARVVRERLLRI